MKRTVIATLTLFIAIVAIGCGAKKDDNLDIMDAADPYDESELWNRASINCTVALYDADEDIMYIFIKDT